MAKKGWYGQSARHSLAARGLRTPHKSTSMSEYGLKKSGSLWGRGNKPILELSTSPSFEDVYGEDMSDQYDHLLESYPDMIEDLLSEKDMKLSDVKNKSDKNDIVTEFYLKHPHWFSDDAEFHWESETDYFKEILDAAGFESGMVEVSAGPSGWHGQRGSLEFYWDGDINKFISKTFGALDRNFNARVNKVGKNIVEATVYCHDIPTGSHVEIRRVKDEE